VTPRGGMIFFFFFFFAHSYLLQEAYRRRPIRDPPRLVGPRRQPPQCVLRRSSIDCAATPTTIYTNTPWGDVLVLRGATHRSVTPTAWQRLDGRHITSRVRRSHDLSNMARTRPHTQRSVSNLHAGGHLMNHDRGNEDQKNLTTECVIVARSTTGRRQTCRYRSYPDSDLR